MDWNRWSAEYSGPNNVTGPSYINNGHTPTSGEGTDGCGCYIPGSIPLPIELLWFKGKSVDSSIKLEWATATEENFDKFIVERSHDGTDFHSIGQVNGLGINSRVEQFYSLIDAFPISPRNYYRLKSVDLDGKYDYSKIIKVDFGEERRVVVFPNPVVNQTLTVRINFEPMSYDNVQILSSLGNVIMEYSVTSLENTINFDGKLESGVYILRYVSKDEEKIFRFVVNN